MVMKYSDVSRGLFRSFARTLPLAAAVAVGLSSFSVSDVQAQSPNDSADPSPAVAKANKSASVEPGHSPIQPVNFDLLVQNEATTTPQPPAAPPAQPAPKKPTAKPAPSTKVPAPPAIGNSTNPATASPAVTTDSLAESRLQNPFASFEPPRGRNPFLSRFSRTPDVFGDSFIPVSVNIDIFNLTGMTAGAATFVDADLPLGGGMRRFKNEHARALPTDRVFFLYNHFHNALRFETDNTSTTDSVDQFTFGFEKTSDDGQWSFELRMPFSGDANLSGDDVAVDSNGVGNLVGTLKRILYSDSTFVTAAGLAVVVPTGSDASVTFRNSNARLDFENEAVHLLPYLAVQSSPDENWFFHAFAQIDIAANENEVSIVGNGFTDSDSLADQTLLYLDGSVGYWWYQSADDSGLTGLASVVELHYTTTLNDADTANLNGALIGNFENRYDVLNLTAGVHSEWSGNTAVRVAVVVPLDRDERFFDSETQVSVIRRY
jgi:hypothetical protein